MPRILAVDDDPDILALVSYKLTKAGFEVVTASDGQAALDQLATSQPELLLLDVLMPGLSGFEVLRQLRSAERGTRLPVILLTGSAQEADIERGFELGADDYIVKPFNPRELLSRVNAVLARAVR